MKQQKKTTSSATVAVAVAEIEETNVDRRQLRVQPKPNYNEELNFDAAVSQTVPSTRKTVVYTRELPKCEPNKPRLPSPILTMDRKQIYNFIRSRIKEQDGAIATLADQLLVILNTKESPFGDKKPLLYKMTLAGTSGCGKTETVLWIKYLLGMSPGYEHERQFVDIDGAVLHDESQMNSLIGAGAGLVGYGEPTTLAHRLNDALRMTSDEEEDNALQHLKKNSAEYREAKKKLHTERRNPRFILLFIDEVDKASPTFLNCINGLLDTGAYRTNNGVVFTLPKETALLILFTCNYGESGIVQMKQRNPEIAKKFVESDMMIQGALKDCNIERMGKIIAFYPLKPEALKRILMERLEQFILNSEISKQYGSERIDYDEEVKNFLIDTVLEAADRGKGVRNGLRLLFDNINVLFQQALSELNKLVVNERKTLAPDEKIVLSKHDIKVDDFDTIEQECERFVKQLINTLLHDGYCLDMLPAHRERKEPINAVSISVSDYLLAASGFRSVTYAQQTNIIFKDCNFSPDTEKYAVLKEENRELKETLNQVAEVVDDVDLKHPLFRKVKGILDGKRNLLATASEEVAIEELDPEPEPEEVSTTPLLLEKAAEMEINEETSLATTVSSSSDETTVEGDERPQSRKREHSPTRENKSKKARYNPSETHRSCKECAVSKEISLYFSHRSPDGKPHYRRTCNACQCRAKRAKK